MLKVKKRLCKLVFKGPKTKEQFTLVCASNEDNWHAFQESLEDCTFRLQEPPGTNASQSILGISFGMSAQP